MIVLVLEHEEKPVDLAGMLATTTAECEMAPAAQAFDGQKTAFQQIANCRSRSGPTALVSRPRSALSLLPDRPVDFFVKWRAAGGELAHVVVF